jgi:hypothetical protein
MADTLRIKRRTGGAPGAPAGLANAELAFNEVDDTLYYGKGTGGAGGTATTVIPIGGQGLGSAALPLMDGVAAAGTSSTHSKGDHVHPTDTTRAPINSPAFTGVPTTATTPANGDNTTKLATTAYVLANRLDQFLPPNIDVAWNSKRITGLLDPSAAQDAATKAYVDSIAQGIDPKASCLYASTANLTLNGPQTVDGFAAVVGDRVLVKDQSVPSTNGIYIVQVGVWTRPAEADTWNELVAAFTFIEKGTINADSGWLCTIDPGGTLGTTSITWTQFSGAGQLVAGAGLLKTGNQVDVGGTANRITVAADSIDIAANYAGQSSIVTVGAITTGAWNGNIVGVVYGGSGAATFPAGYLKANGTNPFATVATIPNADIAGLGSMALQNANAVAITGGTIDGVTFDCGTF